jgi:hypothetical protein
MRDIGPVCCLAADAVNGEEPAMADCALPDPPPTYAVAGVIPAAEIAWVVTLKSVSEP